MPRCHICSATMRRWWVEHNRLSSGKQAQNSLPTACIMTLLAVRVVLYSSCQVEGWMFRHHVSHSPRTTSYYRYNECWGRPSPAIAFLQLHNRIDALGSPSTDLLSYPPRNSSTSPFDLRSKVNTLTLVLTLTSSNVLSLPLTQPTSLHHQICLLATAGAKTIKAASDL